MAGTVADIFSEAELHALCKSHEGLTTVLLWAPWHSPSVHLSKVLEALAAEHSKGRFAKANADLCPGLVTALGADQVPFAAFLNPRGARIDVLAGADPPRLVEKVKALASRSFDQAVADVPEAVAQDLTSRLKALVNFSPVMLFMKGSKVEPFCKFSKQAIAILEKHSIEYSTFDILQDEDVRQGLKDFSDWKTYPQLYVNGTLLGGVDILKEMDEDGSLLEAVGVTKEQPLQERLHGLINQAPVMLFMKGTPDEPRCGFSKKVVSLLGEHSIKYDSFDILSDEEVRQGLKEYSNWPTYPQVYAGGKLVGGLDILKELADEGALLEELAP
mmetsp:Transcript_1846/g.4331  ORF Transcript_1846/g.4331 Transcript_1846/m.4331 type:complete len:330 (+) Transcript_1846:45-1034(+)